MKQKYHFVILIKLKAENRLIPYSPKSHRLNAILRDSQIIKKSRIALYRRPFIINLFTSYLYLADRSIKQLPFKQKLLSVSYQTASFKVRKSNFRCIFKNAWTSSLAFLGVFIIFSGRKNFSSACFLIFPGTIRTANPVQKLDFPYIYAKTAMYSMPD